MVILGLLACVSWEGGQRRWLLLFSSKVKICIYGLPGESSSHFVEGKRRREDDYSHYSLDVVGVCCIDLSSSWRVQCTHYRTMMAATVSIENLACMSTDLLLSIWNVEAT